MSERPSASVWLAAGGFGALLLGLFAHSLASTWNDGASYYSHGWVVSGAAVILLLMRWREATQAGAVTESGSDGWRGGKSLTVLGLCVAVIFVARLVWTVDVSWRPPLWAQALATVGALATLIRMLSGQRAMLAALPVLLLLLLCVPWPSSFEQAFVNLMTESVVDLSAFCLRATGTPVGAAGNSLFVAGQQLMVAEGCSGLRSFQGSLAGALLIAEYFRLRAWWRVSLVVCSLLAAFLLNGLRVLVLAKFADGGTEISGALHDRAGNLTMVLLFALIFVIAVWMERRGAAFAASGHSSSLEGEPARA